MTAPNPPFSLSSCMASPDWQAYARKYFNRFADAEPILEAPGNEQCQISIVIPCHNEPDLIGTLNSLTRCEKPADPVEVIVVVNQAEGANEDIDQQNQQTIGDFQDWVSVQPTGRLQFHLIKALSMPKKQAGVGLARKIGMDEALRRFVATQTDGSIVCLDADCRVSPNYLQAIVQEFVQSNAGLGEMYYEHLFEKEGNAALQSGIVNYELFLRYYVHGLRQAGFPNAIQTIGSCMLVKASVYAKHGGMNKRKAGEDFYFLHKIIPHERFKVINLATVYPSCRTSDRVPFGTGKAQQDWIDQDGNDYPTYDPVIFEELKTLLNKVSQFFTEDPVDVADGLSEANKQFILEHKCLEKIKLIRANTKDFTQFNKQFFIWFEGFMCMKFVHYLRDHFYPNKPIHSVAGKLIRADTSDPELLLEKYRLIDRQA